MEALRPFIGLWVAVRGRGAGRFVAGLKTAGALARVNLTVTDGTDELSWGAPVWFCGPWPHPFGLAGLEGFRLTASVDFLG